MALRLRDADLMIEAAEKADARLFVVKQNRYNLPIVKLKEALDKGRFGRLVLGAVRVRWCRRQDYYDQAPWRGTWAMDGGVFSNQASHHVDMLVHMMGEVEEASALTTTRLVSIEAEDTGIAMLRFRNGALGVIEATTAARPVDLEGSISILGQNGTVEVGGFAMNEMKVWRFADPLLVSKITRNKFFSDGEAGVGSENHIGKFWLRRNELDFAIELRQGRVQIFPLFLGNGRFRATSATHPWVDLVFDAVMVRRTKEQLAHKIDNYSVRGSGRLTSAPCSRKRSIS